MLWKVGVYIRLSRDDDYTNSNSINNQKLLIEEYVKSNDNCEIVDYYIDDGYSGTNFDRPAFKKLFSDISIDKINMIIVKDLSRLGRNHIEVSTYLESIFPLFNVRFVSINDNYDNHITKNVMDKIDIPFKNVMYDYIAYDISKKVKSTFDMKKKKGEHIGSSVPYGYRKDPKDNHYFIVDEEAADVVRNIFNMFLLGKTKKEIVNILNERGILNPSSYKKENGLSNNNSKTTKWNTDMVDYILKKETYTGVIIQNKYKSENYRTHKQIINDKDNWIVNENHHEAIVSKKVFDNVQELLKNKKRVKSNNSNDIFFGYLKCADCLSPMYVKQGKNKKYYYCSKNRTKGTCSKHCIREDILTELLLEQIELCGLVKIKRNKITRNFICKNIDNIYVNDNQTIKVEFKYKI